MGQELRFCSAPFPVFCFINHQTKRSYIFFTLSFDFIYICNSCFVAVQCETSKVVCQLEANKPRRHNSVLQLTRITVLDYVLKDEYSLMFKSAMLQTVTCISCSSNYFQHFLLSTFFFCIFFKSVFTCTFTRQSGTRRCVLMYTIILPSSVLFWQLLFKY